VADTHELPKKYRICCDSACAVDFEEIGANKYRTCADADDDCAELRKKVGREYPDCKCLLFRLPLKPGDKERWKPLTTLEERKATGTNPEKDKDGSYQYKCFCVAEET